MSQQVSLHNVKPIDTQNEPLAVDMNQLVVDVGAVAKKVFASIGATITNGVLSLAIYAMHLTAFTTLPSFMGRLTTPLFEANRKFSEHAYTPFAKWAVSIEAENERITKTNKIFEVANGKLLYYPKNHLTQSHNTFKAVVAPISASLIALNAGLWVAIKPLWLAVCLPGMLAEMLIIFPMAMSAGIGFLTYEPLKDVSREMLQGQMNFIEHMHMPNL